MNKMKKINNQLLEGLYGRKFDHDLACPQYEMVPDNILRKYESIFKRLKLKKPVIVPIRTKGKTGMGVLGQCHSNVAELVEKIGGKAVRGYWLSRKENGTMTAFIWHSVWETPEGSLVCVTGNSTKQFRKQKDFQFVPVKTINPFEEDCYYVEDFILHDDKHKGILVRTDEMHQYAKQPYNWFKKIIPTLMGNEKGTSFAEHWIHKEYKEKYGDNVFNINPNYSNDNLSLSYSGGTQ